MAIVSSDEFAPQKIASAEFPTAFRGYDPDAVRSYLDRLAAALGESGQDGLAALARATTQDRVDELEADNDNLRRQVRELEHDLARQDETASTGGTSIAANGELDEHLVIELLGQETARVLESARSAAADIVKRSEADVAAKMEEAEAQLASARKEARTYLNDKQAEVDELVAQVTSEAEESARTVRTEADDHRQMVLAESSKILTEADESAKESERNAKARAEQIVADAEAIRQQILSEVVVERTRCQTDMEDMVATRDRLTMALRVARSEIDEMSERLDNISVRSDSEGSADPDSADASGLDATVEDEVAKMAAQLDARLEPLPDEDRDDSTADDSLEAEQTTIDLTESADPAEDSTGGSSRPSEPKAKAKKSPSKGRRNSNKAKTTGSTKKQAASSATAVAERDTPEADAVATSDDADSAEAASQPEAEPATDLAPTTDTETETDSVAETDAEIGAEEPATEDGPEEAAGSDADQTEKQRIANGLIEGFTTIELTEADIDLGDGQPNDPDRDLLNIITTVESRSRGGSRGEDHDVNRGDLRIQGTAFRGKLPSAFAARDKALKGLDDVQRSMRRVVNDDQSDVLDRIRGGKGRLKVDELAPFNNQLERYLVPVHRGLLPLSMAGARVSGRVPDAPDALHRLEHAVARYIVERLRIPVIQLIEEDETNDREGVLDPIRSVYRDFRNGSLIDLVEDSAYEAFAIGMFAGIPEGAEVSWMLDPRYDPDPACDINADRGGLIKGDAFPSGHARPLAVPRCRCLVVAT